MTVNKALILTDSLQAVSRVILSQGMHCPQSETSAAHAAMYLPDSD